MTNKSLEQEFFNRLAEKLEELFPKGECKERGPALVLNAEANVIFRDILSRLVLEEINHPSGGKQPL